MSAVLERLSTTDWSAYEHAYGPATDVPDLIRDLVSHDRDTVQKAFWELHGNVIHQNTRYSVTPKVIGHLIELVAADGIPNRAEVLSDILKYLAKLIAGPFTVRDGFWIGDGERTSGYDDPEIASACYQAALPGIPALLDLAVGRSHWVRTAAISVLGCFRTERDTIVPLLRQRLETETADNARAAIVFALGMLTGDVAELREIHVSDPAKMVRTVAAITLALNGFGNAVTVTTLIMALADDDLDRWYADLPWGHERLAGDIGHVLANLPPELAAPAIPGLGRALLRTDKAIEGDRMALVQVIGLVAAVGAIAFPNGEVAEWTPVQRQAVEVLVRARGPWMVGNVFEMLAFWGLSTDRAENAQRVGVQIDDEENDGPSVDDRMHAAIEQIQQGDAEGGLAALNELPEESAVLLNRAWAYSASDRAEDSIRAYEYTTERYPDLGQAWTGLSFALHTAGRNEEALAAVDNAIRCNSSDGNFYYLRTVCLAALGDLDGAFQAAYEVADRNPEFIEEMAEDPAAAELVADPRWAALRSAADRG